MRRLMVRYKQAYVYLSLSNVNVANKLKEKDSNNERVGTKKREKAAKGE